MKSLSFALLTGCIVMTAGKMQAQGTISLNNYDSRMGIFGVLFGLVAAPAGTRFEVLGGPTPSSLNPIMALAGQGPIFEILDGGVNALGPGSGSFFNEGSGAVPGVPLGGTAFLNVRAWTAAWNSWESAEIRGETGVWSQQIGTAGTPATLAMPRPVYMILIPEPSTIALAVLGLAGWLALRLPKR